MINTFTTHNKNCTKKKAMERIIYNNIEMWYFGEEEGKCVIGLDAHATILVPRSEIEFLNDKK